MAKPRAQGADVIQSIAQELTYGTPPASGSWWRFPMRSDSVAGEQELEDDVVWNTGNADDGDPAEGAFNVNGDLEVPMDVRSLGYIMRMCLGASTVEETTEGVLWTHTWKSGGTLFSYSKQVFHPQLTPTKGKTQLGMKAGGFSFPMARNGRAVITVPFIAKGEVTDSVVRDADPGTYEYLPFDNATGSVKIDGVVMAGLTGLQFNFSNNLEAVEEIREDMQIAGADETRRSASGTANLRLGANSTVDDLVDNKTPCELQFSFKIRSQPTWVFTVTLHRVFFARTKGAVTGPGGIEQATTFRAARDATADCMMTVTLANDVAAYT